MCSGRGFSGTTANAPWTSTVVRSSGTAKHARIHDAVPHAVAAQDIAAASDLVSERWAPRLDGSRHAGRCVGWRAPGRERGRRRAPLAREGVVALVPNRSEDGARAFRAASDAGLTGSFPDGTTLEAELQRRSLLPARRCGRDARGSAARARPSARPEPPTSVGSRRSRSAGRNTFSGDWAPAEASLFEAATAAVEREQWVHASMAKAILSAVFQATGDFDGAEASARSAHSILDSEVTSSIHSPAAWSIRRSGPSSCAPTQRRPRRPSREGVVGLRAHGEPLFVADALLGLAPVRRGRHGTGGRAGLHRGGTRVARWLRRPRNARPDRLESVARSLTPAYRRIEGNSELTEREREVLRYLAEGMPKRDIGVALFLSYNTIHSHTKSIYQKLRVSSRQAAVERARELGAL